MMKVSDLKPNQIVDPLVLEITELGDVRDFVSYSGGGKVCNGKARDESGEVGIVLWNEDTKKYSVGQTIGIIDGWCKEFRGELQVSKGRSGTIKVVKK